MDNRSGDKIGNTGENIVNFEAYKESLPQGEASVDARKVLGSMEGNIEVAPEINAGTELGKIETVEPIIESVEPEADSISIEGIKIDGDKGLNATGMVLVSESEKKLNDGDVAGFYSNIRNAVPSVLEGSFADRRGAVEKMGKVA